MVKKKLARVGTKMARIVRKMARVGQTRVGMLKISQNPPHYIPFESCLIPAILLAYPSLFFLCVSPPILSLLAFKNSHVYLSVFSSMLFTSTHKLCYSIALPWIFMARNWRLHSSPYFPVDTNRSTMS